MRFAHLDGSNFVRRCDPRISRPRLPLAEMLQTHVLIKLSTIVRQAQTIQSGHLDSLKSRVTATDAAFQALDPAKDQVLFIEHNVSHFAEPPDWSFEPCSTHYDTVSDNNRYASISHPYGTG